MSEKTTGYMFLWSGIGIMIFSLVFIIFVFTGVIEPIGLFSIKAPTLESSSIVPTSPSPFGSDTQDQEIELIPTDQFNKLINVSVTFFLMGFIMTFGAKIAHIGVLFLRPVQVSLKEQTHTPQTTD